MSTSNPKRPVSLPILGGIYLPFAAIASITHRITGLVLFVGVGVLLYLANLALPSAEGYAEAAALVNAGGWVTFLVWGTLVSLAYHLFAGIKHLALDFHVGDTVDAAFYSAVTVVVLTVACAVWLGMWLW